MKGMGKHGQPADSVCPWCLRRFADRDGVEQHVRKKHRGNLVRHPEDEARAKLQAYHQDRLAQQQEAPSR